MNIIIRPPKTEKEFEDYYNLRWEILRQPQNEPRGSEKDKLEETAEHVAAFDNDLIVGCGRLHFNNPEEAKIRFMAVAEKYQSHGIGGKIIEKLEEIARKKKTKFIVLDARATAVDFYKKYGFEITEKDKVLFDSIPHWRMRKELK